MHSGCTRRVEGGRQGTRVNSWSIASTTHNLLQTSLERNFVETSRETKQYLAGLDGGDPRRGRSLLNSMRDFCRPYMETLANEFAETVVEHPGGVAHLCARSGRPPYLGRPAHERRLELSADHLVICARSCFFLWMLFQKAFGYTRRKSQPLAPARSAGGYPAKGQVGRCPSLPDRSADDTSAVRPKF